MARHKKFQQVEQPVDNPEIISAPEVVSAPEPEMVKILSQRRGDVIVKGGVVLQYNMVLEVPAYLARYLVEMHPGEIRIL